MSPIYEDAAYWNAVDTRINGATRAYVKQYKAEVVEATPVAATVKVRLPGEDLTQADLPNAPVIGEMPAVGEYVLTLVDFAGRRVLTPGGGSAVEPGVTDHGALAGLADDDHTQYYNQLRGDARYIRTVNTIGPDANGNVTVSGGNGGGGTPGPTGAFSASHSSVQSAISSSTWTKVTYPTEDYDEEAWYNASNSTYTPLEAGYYLFTAHTVISPGVLNTRVMSALYKNGVQLMRLGQWTAAGNSGVGGGASGIAYADGVDDYFEIYLWHNTGSSPDMLADTSYKFQGIRFADDTGGAVGVTDHGALTGLADDDHPQYQKESEKGQPNGYASLGSGGIVPSAQLGAASAQYFTFFEDGTLALKTGVGREIVMDAATITEVRAAVSSAPSGAALALSLKRNGTQFTTLSIANGATAGSVSGLSSAVVAGDYLTVDIVAPLPSTPGANLTVKLKATS